MLPGLSMSFIHAMQPGLHALQHPVQACEPRRKLALLVSRLAVSYMPRRATPSVALLPSEAFLPVEEGVFSFLRMSFGRVVCDGWVVGADVLVMSRS